jgi:hypothetical protein
MPIGRTITGLDVRQPAACLNHRTKAARSETVKGYLDRTCRARFALVIGHRMDGKVNVIELTGPLLGVLKAYVVGASSSPATRRIRPPAACRIVKINGKFKTIIRTDP